jgi:alkylation response protein AidB-like acyl-CoA dehydrogenase
MEARVLDPFPPEAVAFRAELRAWLEANLDDDIRAAGSDNGGAPTADALEVLRKWQHKLSDAGYAAIAWPKEYGGRGAGVLEQVIHAEEMDRAGAPFDLNPIGMANIAPAIMTYGTEEQKRTLLPRMLRGDDLWCQGFSEPGAGSDLASLRTAAVRDGDAYVVNGQKVWTSMADVADWCELLVRTDPEAPKHRGISTLLLDMSLPGIEVRPLRTMTGENDFSEVFFDNVRVPVSALLGPENDGWRVAITTLANERAGVLKLYLGMRRRVASLYDAAREAGRADDPVVRQALARCYLEVELLKGLSDASVRAALDGREPGPEGSLGKLFWAQLGNHIAEAAGLVLGPTANTGQWGNTRVYTPAMSIAGGTTAVNKNIIATRVLGLPRS